MRKLIVIIVLSILTGAVTTRAATLPRESPEFMIAQPGRTAIPLSSLRGKVVVMEFMFINSAHCLRVAQVLNRLYGELGGQGLQPIGIVFDPPNMASTGGQFLASAADYLDTVKRSPGCARTIFSRPKLNITMCPGAC